MPRLTFLGCGDAFGSGGRFNACFHVETATSRFLVDCGATSMVAIRRFGIAPEDIDTILISHLHGDHFGGLPFFLLDAQFVSRRTRQLTLIGPPTFTKRLESAMECLFPGSSRNDWRFPLDVQEIGEETPHEFTGGTVTAWRVKHACGAPPYALRIETDGKTFAYTGDTEWVDALVPACRGADLMVAEAYTADKPLKFHLDLKTLETHLSDIAPERLILTHLSGGFLEEGAPPGFEVAEDGLVVDF